MQIAAKKYAQLHNLCWNRPDDAVLEGPEALALYERNWRFIEADDLEEDEKNLISKLVIQYGNGVFMNT